jgi:hypothetical protein
MARWLLLVALLAATGCGGYADSEGATVAPGTFVWLPSDSPGYAAQNAWGLGLRANPSFVFESLDRTDELCTPSAGHHSLGCFMQWDDGTSAIVVRSDLDEATRADVILHEIGHAIRPDLPHLTEGCADDNARSQHVMCADQRLVKMPTEGDFDWALSSVSAEPNNTAD